MESHFPSVTSGGFLLSRTHIKFKSQLIPAIHVVFRPVIITSSVTDAPVAFEPVADP